MKVSQIPVNNNQKWKVEERWKNICIKKKLQSVNPFSGDISLDTLKLVPVALRELITGISDIKSDASLWTRVVDEQTPLWDIAIPIDPNHYPSFKNLQSGYTLIPQI